MVTRVGSQMSTFSAPPSNMGPIAARRAAARGRASAIRLRRALIGTLLALVTSLGVAGTANAATYDMRGEWSYSITCSCGESATGTFLFTQMEPTNGAFSGTTEWDGGVATGTASGMVTGPSSLSLEIVLPHGPPTGAELAFTMSNASLETATSAFSGTGTYKDSAFTGEVKAKLVRTLAQIEKEEHEAIQRAKEEREAREKRAAEEAKIQEAKAAEEKLAAEKAEAEKLEREARERPAKEKAEKEAKEKQQAAEQQATKEHEAKQATEKAEAEKHELQARERSAQESIRLASVAPTGKAPTVRGGGEIAIDLSNTNAFAVSGSVALDEAPAHGKTSPQHKTAMLGQASFTISAHGTKVIEIRLSSHARTMLAHRRTLHLMAAITTTGSGHGSTVMRYTLQLTAGSSHHAKP
jgi:hypothetical protein